MSSHSSIVSVFLRVIVSSQFCSQPCYGRPQMLNAPWTEAVSHFDRYIRRDPVHRPRLWCNGRASMSGRLCELVFDFGQCHAAALQSSHVLNTGEMLLGVLGSSPPSHRSRNEASTDVVANRPFRHSRLLGQLIQTDPIACVAWRRLPLLGPVHDKHYTIRDSVKYCHIGVLVELWRMVASRRVRVLSEASIFRQGFERYPAPIVRTEINCSSDPAGCVEVS